MLHSKVEAQGWGAGVAAESLQRYGNCGGMGGVQVNGIGVSLQGMGTGPG